MGGHGRKRETRVLDGKDVIRLLRSEVKRAGIQEVWARKAGVQRTMVSKILNGRAPPTKKVISLLKLRIVYVSNRPRVAIRPPTKWWTT